MQRRLTFDAHPTELATRDSGQTHISLLWSRRLRRAAVVVEDGDTGEVTELDVERADDPLDVYEHALAYLSRRGHPGRPPAATRRPAAA